MNQPVHPLPQFPDTQLVDDNAIPSDPFHPFHPLLRMVPVFVSVFVRRYINHPQPPPPPHPPPPHCPLLAQGFAFDAFPPVPPLDDMIPALIIDEATMKIAQALLPPAHQAPECPLLALSAQEAQPLDATYLYDVIPAIPILQVNNHPIH